MIRNSFLYAVVVSLLFLGFLSILENSKASAGLVNLQEENAYLHHQWVVAGVDDKETSKDITARFASEVWQFLPDGGFVKFRDQIIENTGEWEIRGEQIVINSHEDQEPKVFEIKKVRRNEIQFSGNSLKVRLLKLDDK